MTTRPEDEPRVATAHDHDDLPDLPTDAIENFPVASRSPSHDEIAELARSYYRAGSADTFGNWVRAESELRQALR